MASPILYSFVNTTLKESYGERGLVISSMMTVGFCTQIWVPLFTFPTVQAPRFPNGYPAAAVFEFCMWGILVFGVWYMRRWKGRRGDVEVGEGGEVGDVRGTEGGGERELEVGDGDEKVKEKERERERELEREREETSTTSSDDRSDGTEKVPVEVPRRA